jgi:hypothetical protein
VFYNGNAVSGGYEDITDLFGLSSDVPVAGASAMTNVDVSRALEQMYYVETTTAYDSQDGVRCSIEGVKARLRDAGVDESVLDESGLGSVEEGIARLECAKNRGYFVVACKDRVSAGLRNNGFDAEMHEPIVGQLVSLAEANGDEAFWGGDISSRDSFIEANMAQASAAVARKVCVCSDGGALDPSDQYTRFASAFDI